MIRLHPRQLAVRAPGLLALSLLLVLPLWVTGQAPSQPNRNQANYKLARKFSTSFLRQFVYSSSVNPHWIGKSDRFWYSFKTSSGTHYWLLDPVARTKVSLFDQETLAALLSEACETPLAAESLSLGDLKLDKTGETMTFQIKGFKFAFNRTSGKLEKKGKATKAKTPANRGRRGGRRGTGNRSEDQSQKKDKGQQGLRLYKEVLRKQEEKKKNKGKEEEQDRGRVRGRRRGRRTSGPPSSPFSPDLKAYVFARKNNLYYVQESPELARVNARIKAAKAAKGEQLAALTIKSNGKGGKLLGGQLVRTVAVRGTNGDAQKVKARGKLGARTTSAKKKDLIFPFNEKKALQLSRDGAKDYSFGGDEKDDTATPARVNWAPDSSAFYVTRGDSRGVAELYLVNSLAQPRPTLQKYKYPMPGEDKVRRSELFVFERGQKKLIRIKPKWKDESYTDVQWLKNGELRLVRRDRLRRDIEYGIVNPKTGDFKALFNESVKNADLNTQRIRYLEQRKELIWWSERSGWGHYYLYGLDGKFKHAITRGHFRSSRIVDVDEEKGVLWFRGNGREPGENIYYEHLYRVRLDGGGLTLLDPGNATHRSSISKSHKCLVDNFSRVDLCPASVLRDSEGQEIMKLEQDDLSKLAEMGWKPPQPFKVKAADGITDLYGNMWKPFDFDPKKKYPLIVHVYPGPQTEGVTHTFSATGSGRQELAQLGFIVIQVGHRGGSPNRSKAYGSFGYFNLRDYGLADKKAAIEQLAARHAFIYIDRIGIYGHSGGGFMTAAALLKKPYNKFFKVGVSSSGNHDNNIYGYYWAERYHGLKKVKAKEKKKEDAQKKGQQKGDRKTDQKDGEKKKKRIARGNVKRRKQGRTLGGRRRRIGSVRTTTKQSVSSKDRRQKSGQEQKQGQKKTEQKTRFKIHVPTNAELAANLEGHLMLVHGEIDNNVHPAGTMRLVDALIKANKRFDLLIIPGARHGYGPARPYFTQRLWEYFAEYLLDDHQTGADMLEKSRLKN